MDNQPQWQPISLLPVFNDMIDGMLDASQEQLANMQLVSEKPHVMDDATLQRVVELYSKQLEDQWLFEEQCSRWLRESLNPGEIREIERLIVHAAKLRASNEQILQIADRIRHSTIDSILGMDEFELMEALASGKLKPPISGLFRIRVKSSNLSVLRRQDGTPSDFGTSGGGRSSMSSI
jgi:hypothetical protein